MHLSRHSIGVGFKPQHLDQAINSRFEVDFVEVHPENYMVDGGPMLRALETIRSHYPVSLHGVGLSLAGTDPIDSTHLARFAQMIRTYQPISVSEHLAWSTYGGTFFNDLLPVPYTTETLTRVCERIDSVQTALGVRILIENPATYVQFRSSTYTEGEFLREVVRRAGCGLLLDVSNAYVASVNHGHDAHDHILSMPLHDVGQIHLAGFGREMDAAGDELLIDNHGAPIDSCVWELYAWVVGRIGQAPTLIERDNNVPPFEEIALEATRARLVAQAVRSSMSKVLRSAEA